MEMLVSEHLQTKYSSSGAKQFIQCCCVCYEVSIVLPLWVLMIRYTTPTISNARYYLIKINLSTIFHFTIINLRWYGTNEMQASKNMKNEDEMASYSTVIKKPGIFFTSSELETHIISGFQWSPMPKKKKKHHESCL